MTGAKMPAVILDISRTVSRLSNANPTGIDRVELAYIKHFLNWPAEVNFLARFRKQSVFLDRNGMQKIQDMMTGKRVWGDLDLIGRLSRKQRAAKIESSVRRLAISWPFLQYGISKLGISNGVYLNVGHGKLMPKLWGQLKGFSGKKVCMVHDVIPLDFPEYCTEKTRRRFEQEFSAMTANADHLIWNSSYTKDRAEMWLQNSGTTQSSSTVIPLGVDLPAVREHTPTPPPYFVTIGTIEPRKNHALLLDIWQDFYNQNPENSPTLHIVGGRGWLNQDVFERLDTSPFVGKTVIEHGYLSDEELTRLLKNSSGLLFPSFTEGFGFPLLDAIASGIPVICSDIPAFKEFGKDYPIYADAHDKQTWVEAIGILSTSDGQNLFNKRTIPEIVTWEAHFSTLSSVLSDLS